MKQIKGMKSKSVLADFLTEKVEDIDFEYLKKQGIKACFFDLDHTILNRGTHDVSDLIVERFAGLDMALYIATNRRYSEDLDKIAKQIRIKGIVHSDKGGVFKPRKVYYEKLIATAGLPPEQIAMVGDRIVQDIWGANRAGVRSVLVEKLGSVTWWDRLVTIPDIIIPMLFNKRYQDV